MKNKNSIYYIILAILVTILILVEYFAPQAIDWRQNFERNSKTPYGSRILHEQLPHCFNNDVRENNLSFFEFAYNTDFTEKSSYLIISTAFEPDKFDLEKILDYTAAGNHVFIAAANLNASVLDTLGLELETTWLSNMEDSLLFKLVNPLFKNAFYFSRSLYNNSFINFNDSTTKILGLNHNNAPNFIRISFRKGFIYINLQPLIFTNYHLLYSNSDYAFNALSYLPENTIWFDEYYKPFKTQSQTPFRYILSNRSFKIALYLILIGLLLYLVFESKRKQRAIPIVEPYRNTSLEFTKMIGKLYLRKRNHKDLAHKKIRYFFEFLRTRYYIDTNKINHEILEELHQKSSVSMETIEQLFNYIAYINDKPALADNDIVGLSNLIEAFKKLSK